MAEYRVEELAQKAGISVELVRSYQSRGLLPAPRHEGRVALYDRRHLERLRRIKDLKAKGWSIRSIGEVLDEPTNAPTPIRATEDSFPIETLAQRTTVPPAVLRSWVASGLLRPRAGQFTDADVRAVASLLDLIGTGVPMEEFMAVADVQLAAVERVAEGTFDLFLRYLRAPLLEQTRSSRAEAEALAGGFRRLLDAVSELLTYNFQRTIGAVAERHLDEHGTKAEQAAVRKVS
jgi:DNA-binding transcriptional MerR regulator